MARRRTRLTLQPDTESLDARRIAQDKAKYGMAKCNEPLLLLLNELEQ